jgi:hypothetical protein
MKKDLPSLFVVSCNSQDSVDSDYLWSLLSNVFAYIEEGGRIFVWRGGHPWDVVRNNAGIDAFLNSDYEVMAKCDVDQWYPKDYFLDMVPLVEEYPVIGPVIYDRGQRSNFAPLVVDRPWGHFINIDNHSGIHKFPYTHTNNFYAREVFENIEKPWYEAHLSEDGLSRANHVDYDVLDKIRKAGYDIYTNCDITVDHITKIRVNREIHEKIRGNHGRRSKRFL